MLVPFVIDAESIVADPNWTGAQLRACHFNLIDTWINLGLLAHDGQTLQDSKLFENVMALPQCVRTKWLEVLERLPLLSAPKWNSEVKPVFLSEFSNIAQLAFVDDVQAEIEFNFDESRDETILVCGILNISICRLVAASQAIPFREASKLSGLHIEVGDTFQKTWDTRFKSLARAPIKNVCVVDRFAIRNHFNSPQDQLSGVERFLRLLDRDSTGDRHVKIYSTWPEELPDASRVSAQEIEAEFRLMFNKLPRKKVKRIKIYMVPNGGFRRDSHDRFIRFGNYVWDIGKGLEVFGAPYCRDRSQAAFKTIFKDDSYTVVEQDLAGNDKTRQLAEIKLI